MISSPLGLAYFGAAVVLLLLAHIVRTLRWRLILKQTGITVSNLQPLASLSLGYLVNTVLPFRLGEVVRGAYLAYAAKANPVSVLATIVFERTIDLLAVAIMALALLPFHHLPGAVLSPAVAALLVVAVAALLRLSRHARQMAWIGASIFNVGLKTALLHFAQSFAGLFASRSLLSNARFLGLTALMWAGYLLSLYLFAEAINASFLSQFLGVYNVPLSGSVGWSRQTQDWTLLAYLTLPVLTVVLFAALTGFNVFARFRAALHWVTRTENFTAAPAELLPTNFGTADHYEAFLDRRFRGDTSLLLAFEERGIGNGLLHRVFHGGSGAITALIEIDGQLLVRKFASGQAGQTLLAQVEWIERFATSLPLVQTLGSSVIGEDRLYDMVYLGGTRDLYEAIHTETLAASATVLANVVERMDSFHRAHALADASEVEVGDYLTLKARANLAIVTSALPEIFRAGQIDVNGRPFNLAALDIFRTREWLAGKLSQRRQSAIHGDLTIENIMILPEPGPANWFLIDPNPRNGFQSPLIDFAKLMQSLHLGYEAVHRDPRASFADGKLSVSLHRSSQYSALFAQLCDDLQQRFGAEGLQQIFLHEMINYLRLIPYQLRRSTVAGTAFFACLCILIQDYQDRYPDDLPC